jgi:hypothetical protein
VIETLVLELLIPVTDDIITNRSFIFTDIIVWFRKCVTCNKMKDSSFNISITKTRFYGQD